MALITRKNSGPSMDFQTRLGKLVSTQKAFRLEATMCAILALEQFAEHGNTGHFGNMYDVVRSNAHRNSFSKWAVDITAGAIKFEDGRFTKDKSVCEANPSLMSELKTLVPELWNRREAITENSASKSTKNAPLEVKDAFPLDWAQPKLEKTVFTAGMVKSRLGGIVTRLGNTDKAELADEDAEIALEVLKGFLSDFDSKFQVLKLVREGEAAEDEAEDDDEDNNTKPETE